MRRSSWSKARVPGWPTLARPISPRSEEHTSELQSQSNLVCRLLLEKKKIYNLIPTEIFVAPVIPDFVSLQNSTLTGRGAFAVRSVMVALTHINSLYHSPTRFIYQIE